MKGDQEQREVSCILRCCHVFGTTVRLRQGNGGCQSTDEDAGWQMCNGNDEYSNRDWRSALLLKISSFTRYQGSFQTE